MVSKKVISDVISQYSLGGEIEKVKWQITDDDLYISFKNGSKTIAGEIKHPGNLGLKKGTYGIYDTSKLTKCLNILDGELLMEAKSINGTPSILNIADTNYEIRFNLASAGAIEDTDVSKIKTPEEESASFDITDEFITRFVKSKNALSDIEKFTIKTRNGFNGDELVFTIGTELRGSTIEFTADATVSKQFKPIPFSAESFKEILKANKSYESGKLTVYNEGFIVIDFNFENKTTTKYFIIRLQDVN
jgi:hypothetical protein|tara:strand:+ start:596 stop:1339 length:744 start_codon:yes stop_codon:yes gene_type:complete